MTERLLKLDLSKETHSPEAQAAMGAIIAGANQTLVKYKASTDSHEIKAGDRSIVTVGDLASQQAILEILTQSFPDDAIYSEEEYEVEGTRFKWYIDPIDGTRNYAHGWDEYAVTAGRFNINQQQQTGILSVTCIPKKGELYIAQAGKSLTLVDLRQMTEQTVRVSQHNWAERGGHYVLDDELGRNNSQHLSQLKQTIYFHQTSGNKSGRSTGSNLVNQMIVARGLAHFGITQAIGGLQDILPGALAVKAAGGQVSLIRHQATNNIVAMLYSNGQGHDRILDAIRPILEDYPGWHGHERPVPQLQQEFAFA